MVPVLASKPAMVTCSHDKYRTNVTIRLNINCCTTLGPHRPGTPEWPAERLVPQVSIEFDVANAAAVKSAAQELEQAGFALLHPGADGAVGADRRQAAIAGRRDRRHFVHPNVPRRELTGDTTSHLTTILASEA
jgi:hypothetical protein